MIYKLKNNLAKQAFCLAIVLFVIYPSCAQLKIKLHIQDSLLQQNITNAIIHVLDIDSVSILTFAYSDTEGGATVEVAAPRFPIILKINKLGFKPMLLVFSQKEDITKTITCRLTEEDMLLDEFMVIDRQKIKEKKDTVTFDVERFRDSTERNLEKLLEKLPGMEVEKNSGIITFRGKVIKKILVEGDDISGADYRIVSRSVDPALLETVQVIDKFEANDFLKNTFTSDDQVINISLKKRFKVSVSGDLGVGLGIPLRQHHEAKLLAFSPNIKALGSFSYNTIGITNESILQNSFNTLPRTAAAHVSAITPKYDMPSFMNELNVLTLPISSTMYLLNDNHLTNLNFAAKRKSYFKLNGFIGYSKENNHFSEATNTTYKTQDSLFVLQEKLAINVLPKCFVIGLNNEINLSKKSQFSYQGYYQQADTEGYYLATLNQNTFENKQPLLKKINSQSLSYVYKVTPTISWINTALIINQQQNIQIITQETGHRKWINNEINIGQLKQNIQLYRNVQQYGSGIYWGKDSSKWNWVVGYTYASQQVAMNMLLFDTIKQSQQASFNSTNFSILYNSEFFSQLRWAKKWKNADAFIETKIGHLNINDESIRNLNYKYFMPHMGFNQWFSKSRIMFAYHYDITLPAFNNLITNTYWLSDYRNIYTGLSEVSLMRYHKFLINYVKSDLSKGYNYYANLSFQSMQGGYQQKIDINNDFVAQYNVVNTFPNKRLILNIATDNFIDKISSRVFVKPFASYTTTQNSLSNEQQLVAMIRYGGNVEVKSGFLNWFNFHIGINKTWKTTNFSSHDGKSFFSFTSTNIFSNLYFNLNKYSRFVFENEWFDISSEGYHDNTRFTYANLLYFFNPKNEYWSLSLKIHNLFNTSKWLYADMNSLSLVESSTNIIPRYFMVRCTYKFNSANTTKISQN